MGKNRKAYNASGLWQSRPQLAIDQAQKEYCDTANDPRNNTRGSRVLRHIACTEQPAGPEDGSQGHKGQVCGIQFLFEFTLLCHEILLLKA